MHNLLCQFSFVFLSDCFFIVDESLTVIRITSDRLYHCYRVIWMWTSFFSFFDEKFKCINRVSTRYSWYWLERVDTMSTRRDLQVTWQLTFLKRWHLQFPFIRWRPFQITIKSSLAPIDFARHFKSIRIVLYWYHALMYSCWVVFFCKPTDFWL